VNIVDLRDADSFAQGPILHAQAVNEQNIKAFVQETDKDKPLICYCYHGISSRRRASFFASQGFKQVYSIDGGWDSWKGIYG
jgi:thiosulfate sulfurtransferase